ncbi:hypothetical protein [Novosphingobium sp.]|uniref:hypothetical protein n=1 Tax=Novosphingobium sp. TaxID=1874826 RepID=UPI00260F9774|nr:hypothetical protein [Novosphingobium sp.]
MTAGPQRRLAALACRILESVLPASQQAWGQAIRHETAAIPDDALALRFALGSLGGLLPQALAARAAEWFRADPEPIAPTPGGPIIMTDPKPFTPDLRKLGMLCAAGAVALGIVHLAVTGAPLRYLGLNLGALLIGLSLLGLLGSTPPAMRRLDGLAMVAAAGALLATGVLGETAGGAARWVRWGGLSLQPSLILVPVMLLAFTRQPGRLGTAGMIGAGLAMAIQPDRAMAAALALGLAVAAAWRPGRQTGLACAAGILALGATLIRADRLPAVPHVDRILSTALDLPPLAGLAALGGSALLLVPAIIGWRRDPAHRGTYAAFGAVWGTAIAAATLGNYPTPVVGYGGSAILGYLLSLAAFPRPTPSAAGHDTLGQDPAEATPFDQPLPLGLA